MDKEQTLSIIKQDGVRNRHTGEILGRFEANGLTIAALKMTTLSKLQAELGGDDFSVVLIASDLGGWEPVNDLLRIRNIDIPESYLKGRHSSISWCFTK